MKKRSNTIFYIVTISGLLTLIFFVLNAGRKLESIHKVNDKATTVDTWAGITEALHHPLAVFIMQVAVVIVAARICSILFQKIGQPAVMGEIVAGILLGPSLMGAVLPDVSKFI